MRSTRLTIIGIAAASLLVGGVAVAGPQRAAAPPPVPYTPPCTTSSDSCRQQRIVALEGKAAALEGRIVALETPAPSSSPTTPPATTPPATPTPTATATTTPPAPGGWPTAATTGVPTGTTLTAYTGPDRITTAGTVISGKRVTDCLEVAAPNVRIERSEVSCNPGGDFAVITNQSIGLVVEDTDVFGTGPAGSCGNGVAFDSYTLTRVHIRACGDGARANGDVAIRDSLMDGFLPGGQDHSDGVQAHGGSGPITLTHNWIDIRNAVGGPGGCCVNGAVQIADGYGDGAGADSQVTMTNNWFAGGGFVLRLHENGRYTVTGNRILANSWLPGSGFGPVTTAFAVIDSWSNNKLISAAGVDGATVNP